jgi:signal-transduction protein with cAMP-binding, CBS, and nucleotidyltransferase domain
METDYKVHQIMRENVVTVGEDALIKDISHTMKEKGVGSVIIVDGKKPLGIVTEQDLVRKVIAQGMDPQMTKVNQVMERRMVSVESSRDLADAVALMGNSEVKHLPVIDHGKLVGIITAKDIIRIEPYFIEMLQFKSSLSKDEAKRLFKKL